MTLAFLIVPYHYNHSAQVHLTAFLVFLLKFSFLCQKWGYFILSERKYIVQSTVFYPIFIYKGNLSLFSIKTLL